MSYIAVLNIFYAICFLPIVLVLWLTMRNDAKPKNNLILSTTIPKEAWDDSRITAIQKKYRRNLDITCLLLLLLYAPILLFDYFSIQFLYLMVWMLFLLTLPSIPYILAVKKIRALKKENWYYPELKKVQVADTSLSAVYEEKQNTYSLVNFLLPFLVNLIPILFPLMTPVEGPVSALNIIVAANALTIAMLYFCYQFAFRRKGDRVNSDVTLTMVLTRIRCYYWGKFWLYAAWLSVLLSYLSLTILYSTNAFLVVMSIYIIAIMALVLYCEMKIREEQHRLNKEQPSEILVDEDDYWIWGMFYHNKNDSNMMVNARVGFGTTVNMAHPAGKGLYILSAVLMLACPFLGIWMMEEEFTPAAVVLTETALEGWHTDREYRIPLDYIDTAELLAELPDASKKAGTNFPHLYKGNFRVKGISDNAKLCLDPYDELFLVVRTKDSKCYIFSMEESSDLRVIYEQLN